MHYRIKYARLTDPSFTRVAGVITAVGARQVSQASPTRKILDIHDPLQVVIARPEIATVTSLKGHFVLNRSVRLPFLR